MHDPDASPPPPEGYLDIHSHLLPGVDDGCADEDESLACVTRLIEAGFTGTICTPHIYPEIFPDNKPVNISQWTRQLRQRLADSGVTYPIWSGGELRLTPNCVSWMQEHGVPTLAESRCVLMDFWEEKWPRCVESTIRWLLDNRYQPILAHPERLPALTDLDRRLAALEQMGVWLQGNFRSMTGEEGYHADRLVRHLLEGGRYRLLAMDMHRPETLEGRLDGLQLVAAEFGQAAVDELTFEAPRKLIFGASRSTGQ